MDEDHKRKLEEVYKENYNTYLSYAKRKLMAYTGSNGDGVIVEHRSAVVAGTAAESSRALHICGVNDTGVSASCCSLRLIGHPSPAFIFLP